MPEPSVTSKLPISGWDTALQAIVRCLEALDASQKSYEQEHWSARSHPDRYGGLFSRIEDFLIVEGRPNSWGAEALAELSLGAGYIRPDRRIRYLVDAAETGYLNAQLELARLADDGSIPPPEYNWEAKTPCSRISQERWEEFNRIESDRWWKAAAENDSALAQYRMCNGLIESDDPMEFAQGVKWLTKATHNRIPHPAAQYELAYLMELGRINPDDPIYRWELYEAAANANVPEAMLAAGHCLEYGIGVDLNLDGAINWYRKAAECGNSEGYLLAGLLSDSDSDLEMAANAGHVEAMLILAPRELDQGYGEYGLRSFLDGVSHFESAASSGCLEAAIALARIYEECGWRGFSPVDWEGVSVFSREHHQSQRLECALACYERARELGWQFADQNIERIQERLDKFDEDADSNDE